MLEWSADQATEITTTAIDLEFLPTDTNEDRGVENQEFLLQQVHTALMALTSYEANDIVANSLKNPLESGGDCRSNIDLEFLPTLTNVERGSTRGPHELMNARA